MTEKYVLIFAKTPYHKTPYDQWLRDSDITPVIITTRDFAGGYAHMDKVFAFDNYDSSLMVEKAALELAREYPPLAVFARAEADIIRAAKLRELIGVAGQGYDSALAYRNKVVMKEHLKSSRIKLPIYEVACDGYSVVKFVEEHGLPVVIKPFSESGSFNTFIIRNMDELDDYLNNPPVANMEIETFVDGKMYHVDGLVVNGKIKICQPFEYINDCLSFREDKYIGNVALDPEHALYQRLLDAVESVIAYLPKSENMAFHCEFWHTPKDEIVFCEIASRTGGGMIATTFRESLGVDLDKLWLYAECGITLNIEAPPYKPCGCICIPPLKGILLKKPNITENKALLFEEFTGAINHQYNGGVKSGLFLIGYVVSGKSSEEVTANIHDTALWFAANSEWAL